MVLYGLIEVFIKNLIYVWGIRRSNSCVHLINQIGRHIGFLKTKNCQLIKNVFFNLMNISVHPKFLILWQK